MKTHSSPPPLKVSHVDAIHCDDAGPSTATPGTRIVATELVIEGGPMHYRRPPPLDAEQVERILREVVRSELAAAGNDSRYWSPQRAARECGVSKRTFAEWMATGKVQFFKPSRRVLIDPTILATDLAKFRRQRTPKRGRPRLPAQT
jgi:hypothetical protein